MDENQKSNLEAIAEVLFMHWQTLKSDDPQSIAAVSAYAQCMNALEQDRIADAMEYFRSDYETYLAEERTKNDVPR